MDIHTCVCVCRPALVLAVLVRFLVLSSLFEGLKSQTIPIAVSIYNISKSLQEQLKKKRVATLALFDILKLILEFMTSLQGT